MLPLSNAIGQRNKDSVIYFPFIRVSLAVQSPQGDFAENYGTNSNIGLSLGLKNKSNQTFELNYNFIHSANVKNTSHKGDPNYHAIRKRITKELINFLILENSRVRKYF